MFLLFFWVSVVCNVGKGPLHVRTAGLLDSQPFLGTMTKYVRTFSEEVTVNQKLCKNIHLQK